MANVLSRFYIGQPGTTSSELYAAGVGKTTIKQILFANQTTSGAKISIYLKPEGSSITNACRIVPNVEIPPEDTRTLDLTQTMNAGDKLVGVQATAGAITVCISGIVSS